MESSNVPLPNSIKFCEYFNEIGLIDYDNINTFLNIYSDVVRTSQNKDENEFLKIALFSYMKLISEDDKTLFDYIKRTLISYNNHQLISRYKSLKEIKNLFYFKLKNIFYFFLFNLVSYINNPKNQKIKINNNNSYQSNNFINQKNQNFKKQLFPNLEIENYEFLETEKNEIKNKKNISYGNINLSQRQLFQKQLYNINNKNIQTTKASSERASSQLKNLENETEMSNNNINKKKNNINDGYDNIQSYTIYAPALQIQSKIPIKNLNNNKIEIKKSRPTSSSNIIVSCLDINNESNFINNSNQKKISSPFLTNKTFNTINNNSYDFYGNEAKHLEKINEKIINMKIDKINAIEQDCTFKPKINKYKSKQKNNNLNNNKNENIENNNNNIPRYIQLNKDAKVRKENLDNLKLQYLNDELEKKFLSNPQNNRSKSINDPLYYEKLYNDAKILKKKNIDNIRKAREEFTFIPEINENPDYIVSIPFQQRINKAIENKKKLLYIKEEKDNQYIEKINLNLKNVKSNEVVNRLYKKEMEKINLKKQKILEEEEKKNKKQHPINWEKLFKENNNKYSENIYYKRKKLNIGKEEEKNLSKNKLNSFDNLIENNNSNEENKILNTIPNKKKEILKDNNLENEENNNISNDEINLEQNYQLHYKLLEKIKNEHLINFKNPIPINLKNLEINNNVNSNSSRDKEKNNFIDIQSLSDNSQNNNDKNSSRDLYASPNTNIVDLTPITEKSNKNFESHVLDSMKSDTLKTLFEEDKK